MDIPWISQRLKVVRGVRFPDVTIMIMMRALVTMTATVAVTGTGTITDDFAGVSAWHATARRRSAAAQERWPATRAAAASAAR